MILRNFSLVCFLFLLVSQGFSQGTNCLGADPFCTGTTYTFPNTSGGSDLGEIDCLLSSPNPAFYFLQIETSGDINIHIAQEDEDGFPIDVDFLCWGPFSSVAAGCAGGTYPPGSGVDCSYEPFAEEDCYIPSAVAGEFYILLLTNYEDVPGTITFSQTGGTGATDCSVVCGVTGFTANPSACTPATNQYSVSGAFSITNPPTTGTLTFTNSCGGTPQVVSAPFPATINYNFTGLPSNGAGCTVSATFSADGTCNSTVNYTAPAPCTTSTCVINNFTANISAPTCGATSGTFDITGVVETTSPPATGTLTVSSTCGGSQVFNPPFPATINYSLTGLNANGASCTITAVYSALPACTQSIPYTAPSCPCNMDNLVVNIGPCDGVSNTYEVDIDLEFSSPPATGVLNITVCGTTQTFNPPFVSPMTVNFAGLPPGVGACNVSATFSASPACTNSIGYTAPADCSCPANAGTFTGTLNGSGTTNYVLCFNDNLDIVSNGDNTPPGDVADPTITYDPGLWLMVFSCPPTVFSPNDLFDAGGAPVDPCYLGIESTADGVWNIANTFGDGLTLYYVPITMYNMADGYYSVTNTTLNCYDFGTPFPVTFLPDITATGVENCAATTVTVTVNGGHPEIFGTQFTASNLVPASASFVNTTCGDGGTIVVTGLADGDNYSFDITDANGCPHTFTGGPFTGPATTTVNPAGPFCETDGAVNLTATTAGGTWSGTGITNAALGIFDPSVAGNGTWTITYQLPGCALPATVDISVSDISFTTVVTNITCNGDDDGVITINSAEATQFSIDNGGTFVGTNTFNGLAPGTYNIMIQSAGGCQATGTATVTEPLLLQVAANTVNNESCAGACNGQVSAVPAGGTAPYSTVVWAGPVSGSGSPLNNACSGTYTATITDANGCTASNTTVVTGPPPPAITFESDTTQGCLMLPIHFDNTMDDAIVASCSWDFGDGSTSASCSPVHVYTSPGCYDVSLTVQTVNGCTIDTTIFNMICAFANPVADFTFVPQPADIFAPTITFTNTTIGGDTYAWDFDGLGTSTQTHPTFTFPNDSGSVYNVCLSTVSTQGCIDSTCHAVIIEDVFLIYVPNAFTPDGDGTNDIFLPVIQGEDPPTYELFIFNRWGEVIFQSNNKRVGWDGTHKGVKAKEDVYVWKLKVRKSINQEKVEHYGHITLLR